MRRRRRARMTVAAVAAAVVGLLAVTGCGSGGGSGDEGPTTLRVFAASSLQPAFEEIGTRFQRDHPGVEVAFSFAGSSDLVAQVAQGAPADVLATADETTMDRVGDDVEGRRDIATNTLEIATPPDDPGGVSSLEDLARPGVDVVVCAPEVPCGAAAAELARRTGLRLSPASEEQSVTDVLARVSSGEADAGLVYVTDVRAAGDRVRGVEVPEAKDVVNVYPAATVAGSEQAALAEEFVAFVAGDEGRQVLADAGFGPP